MKNAKLAIIINNLGVPKVLLRYIIMNFLDMATISKLILTVKQMNVLDDFSKEFLTRAKFGFNYNCENGDINVAKWLYYQGKVDIHAQYEYAFRLCCQNGHLTVAKWLYSLGGVNIHTMNDDAFTRTCINGHLPLAQWLYSLGGVNIYADNGYAFRLSCGNGHLTVVKWLHGLRTIHPLDVNDCDVSAFTLSCFNGQLDVAQWLYSLGIVDIYANYNETYMYTTDKKTRKWLKQIKNDSIKQKMN